MTPASPLLEAVLGATSGLNIFISDYPQNNCAGMLLQLLMAGKIFGWFLANAALLNSFIIFVVLTICIEFVYV